MFLIPFLAASFYVLIFPYIHNRIREYHAERIKENNIKINEIAGGSVLTVDDFIKLKKDLIKTKDEYKKAMDDEKDAVVKLKNMEIEIKKLEVSLTTIENQKNLYYDKFLEWQRSNEEAFLNGNWYVTFPGSNRDRIIVGIKNGRCFVVEAAYGSQNVHLFMLFDFYVNINKKQMILYCRLSTHGVEILNLPKSDYLTFENVDLTSFEFIDKENAIVRCRWERQYEMISPYR